MLVWMLGLSWAQTSGGTIIPNRALATYTFAGQSQPTRPSNTVNSTVPSLCGLSINPNGSVAAPAQTLQGFAGSTIYFPYTFSNTGNSEQDFTLAAMLESASTLSPRSINLILDSNNNQLYDTGESYISGLTGIAANQTVSLLLEVILEDDITLFGDIYLNVVGACSNEPVIQDRDNVVYLRVLEGGVSALTKSSVPSSGSAVMAGDTITYNISFTVNQNQLDNVRITDVLDSNLTTPSLMRLLVNGAVMAGATSFDAFTRTVTALVPVLQPGDNVSLSIITTVSEDVRGNLILANRATLDFDGAPTQETNEVTHTTVSVCGLLITPDGTVAAPAYQTNTLPGQRVVFPYTLNNVGNISAVYDLSTEVLAQSTLRPDQIRIVLDANRNGLVDAGETEISNLTLDPGQSEDVLLELLMPVQPEIYGDALVNLTGVCRGDTSAQDSNNVALASIPLGGFATPLKSADPAAGTRLYPGTPLRYFITFTANGRDLSNVVVTDVLSDLLTAPSSFSSGTITDTTTGLSTAVSGSFNAANRTLTWTLATVPAGMNVTLEVVTMVRPDLTNILANTVIENVATVQSRDNPTISTNTTVHPVAPIDILLRKTANLERVTVGGPLSYTLEVINPDDSLDLQTLVLTDDLPDVLSYQPNTSRLKLADGSEQKLEPTLEGQKLSWNLPPLKAGEKLSVIFEVTVLPGALDVQEIVNTAQVVASDVNGRAVADAAASVATVVEEGPLSAKAVLLGTVFVDYNRNGIYDQDSDQPIENVRLYLSDGISVLSDMRGRYTFLELDSGIETLKVDMTTLPSRLLSQTKDEVKSGLWRVRLEAGLITRQDIPLLPPGALLEIDQVLNVEMGPVRLRKSVTSHQEGAVMHLEIYVQGPLRDLVITDQLPAGAIAGEVTSSSPMQAQGLRFEFGSVPADYTVTIHYPISFAGDLRDTLIVPEITWDVRP